MDLIPDVSSKLEAHPSTNPSARSRKSESTMTELSQLKTVTIVVPVFNEEKNLSELRLRLTGVMQGMPNYNFEVLMIDNGSEDNSPAICRKFVAENERFRYLRFSRNFGIEASFFAGATYASGDALLYLFSDLQDPPELIPLMIQRWEEGNDVVYGVLTKRDDGSILKSWGAYFAYRLIFLLSDVQIPVNATDFRLLSRPVINTLKSCGERNRYMRGLTHWSGFKQVGFEFQRAPRKHGKSKANLWFCAKYAISAMTAFSTKPLRLASVVGFITMLLSVLGGSLYLIHVILSRGFGIDLIAPPPTGLVLIVLLSFFFGGIQCLFLGVIGEYLAQIHGETKMRPAWIEREKINLG